MGRRMFLAALVSMLLPAMAFAGGGAKASSKIQVTNMEATGTLLLAVVANPSDALIAKLQAGTATQADLKAAGGKLLGAREVGSLSVKAGANRLGGVYINHAGAFGAPMLSTSWAVGSNSTLKVQTTGTFAAGPIFNLLP